MTRETPSFRKVLAGFGASHSPHDVFKAFVRVAACAVSCGTREAEYMEEIAHWTKEEASRFAEAFGALVVEMEAEPFTDLLGPAYMDTLGKNCQQHGGEFHTPAPVAQLMARLTAGEYGADHADDGEPLTLSEPACGSGAMILAFAEALPRKDIRRLRVTAIDINVTACNMCFVNTTLWGIPATVIHGDTIRMQFWAQWVNVHRAVPFLWRLAPAHDAGDVTPAAPEMTPEPAEAPLATPQDLAALAPHQGAAPSPAQVDDVRTQLGQLDFGFGVAEDPAA